MKKNILETYKIGKEDNPGTVTTSSIEEDVKDWQGGFIYSAISGKDITIKNNKVYIDSELKEDYSNSKHKNITLIIQGSVNNIDCQGSVQCNDVTGDIDCGGSVTCRDVSGNIDCGGSIKCNNAFGDIDAGGSININKRY